MFTSARVSLYPLRQEQLGPSIEAFSGALKAAGLQVIIGPMSTLVMGGES